MIHSFHFEFNEVVLICLRYTCTSVMTQEVLCIFVIIMTIVGFRGIFKFYLLNYFFSVFYDKMTFNKKCKKKYL